VPLRRILVLVFAVTATVPVLSTLTGFAGWVPDRHLAPGMLATVPAGLLLVLAVSRADRWFLAPAGALLVQLAAAHGAWGMAGSWYFTESLRGVETRSAFLEPGLRTDVSATATASLAIDFEVGAAPALAALLLGPALIVAGAARTAGAQAVVARPA
jgi:hypothetical protein